MKMIICIILVLCETIKRCLSYNSSIPFNWTNTPKYCYVEDFALSDNYRPFVNEIFPIKGCDFNERNKNYGVEQGLNNISFYPNLDFFFPNEKYPPIDTDPPTYMTFKLYFTCAVHSKMLTKNNTYIYKIYFGRSEDYHIIPRISKRTGKPIEFIGNKAILSGRIKYFLNEYQGKKGEISSNITSKDYDFYDYEGKDINVTFDGFELDLQLDKALDINQEKDFCINKVRFYGLLIRVYDLPRMKVQGQFQYRGTVIDKSSNIVIKEDVYTVDTRNIFFQNISMFYNQRVNVTNNGDEPTGEDSGFWMNTPCNQPQMATIMIDYYFFETIHKMQRFGYEFSDRFQLRIHTPYYRKTLTSSYSLFRSQWNKTYEKPRIFIHPIYKFKEYCEKYKNCTKFNYEEWSTDPKWTQYIIDIKNEIIGNEIRINFTELEKIYAADGFNRSKLVININNTMTPHITQSANGLWAELVDTVTNDWVMKTKTNMDEVHGYIDSNEADPYRNFYLTCEIPDNITSDDIEFVVKKYGILQTAHLWFRLDVFNKGITKMYPPRFNVVFKFPPEIIVTKNTFGYTYQYYRIPGTKEENWNYITKDFRKNGLDDGVITNNTFDYKRNMINVSELHPNYPNGDDTLFYTQEYDYLCDKFVESNKICYNIEVKRQFLYYFYDLSISFSKNNTRPIDITVYQIRYVPYHSKDQINRGLHRWNPHHAGWNVPAGAIFDDKKTSKYYGYYYEPILDNYYLKDKNTCEYINLLGSTDVTPYNGPDCVFSFSGGSTIRNNSCEYWSGLIPDKPFTNYARDIYEEFVAYRTLNDDDTFTIDTRTTVHADYLSFGILEPFPGKYTGFGFEILYWNSVENSEIDGEPQCTEFYDIPKVCYDKSNIICKNCHKPIYNVHEYTKEFFIKLKLPEGFHVNATCFGKVMPCYWKLKGYNRFTEYSLQDHLCYYVNDSHIYAFNSLSQLGYCPDSGLFDISIEIDGIYIHENTTFVKDRSGLLTFGFYETSFFVVEYPDIKEDIPLGLVRNLSVQLYRDNVTNDGIGNFAINITASDWFNKDNTFIFVFSELIKMVNLKNMSFNGIYDNEKIQKLIESNGFSHKNEKYDEQMRYLNISEETNKGKAFIVAPYIDYHISNPFPWNFSLINQGDIMVFKIDTVVENYRSFKPIKFDFYYTNWTFNTLFQHEILYFANTVPQYMTDLTVLSNSYFTSDRAIYTFNFLSKISGTYEGDIFEFKTSWKASYINDEDGNGYYINRIIFDKNTTGSPILNITISKNFILNPDSLEEQYIKDIKILDEEEYLVAIYEGIIPIKMKKFIGFKHSSVDTIRTENDSTKFNISLKLVPEILIKKNDILKIKFSDGVLLRNYSECKIFSEKGLNIDDKDFKCEINIEENEIILLNGLRDIGEAEFIFDNISSNSLVDQEIIFVLKDIPMNRTDESEEIFSIEIKTESEGIITQSNIMPSLAKFECGYKCKTCEKDNPDLCLSCIEEFPFYYKHSKECHKKCPYQKYFIIIDEQENKECCLCDQSCKSCEGNKYNCTSCYEPYFLENESCVINCSEGYTPDYFIRKCYPVNYINQSKIVEIIVNNTISETFPVYVQKNVCIIYNETNITENLEEEMENKTEEKEEIEFNDTEEEKENIEEINNETKEEENNKTQEEEENEIKEEENNETKEEENNKTQEEEENEIKEEENIETKEEEYKEKIEEEKDEKGKKMMK